jgi:hypothetical protein
MEYDPENHIPIKIDYYFYVSEHFADASDHSIYKIENYKINE